MELFFNEPTYLNLRERLQNITPRSTAQWGTMNAGQMMKHCQYPIQIAMHKEKFKMRPNFLIKVLFKRMMYSAKPFRRNTPTVSKFKVLGDRDFDSEKEKLDVWMQELWYDRNNEKRRKHPIFGEFTKEQWGILQWKHLDHHFRQFNV